VAADVLRRHEPAHPETPRGAASAARRPIVLYGPARVSTNAAAQMRGHLPLHQGTEVRFRKTRPAALTPDDFRNAQAYRAAGRRSLRLITVPPGR
jgi:hypothetical protein